jgi:hypothetical protein
MELKLRFTFFEEGQVLTRNLEDKKPSFKSDRDSSRYCSPARINGE